MSGGRFDYIDRNLKNEIFGWNDDWKHVNKNVFEDREITELVWDVLELIHAYDWYASGDTGEKTYLEAKNDFKKKWFTDRETGIKRTIDTAMEEVREELYKTYGIVTSGEEDNG